MPWLVLPSWSVILYPFLMGLASAFPHCTNICCFGNYSELRLPLTDCTVPDVGRHNHDPNMKGAGEERGGGGSFGRSLRKEEGIKMMTKLVASARAARGEARLRARRGCHYGRREFICSLAFTCYVGCLMGTARENWRERESESRGGNLQEEL